MLFASKPDVIGPVLAIVQRVIAAWLADEAGIDRASAQCGAATLIQRFGGAPNVNIHFHMLWFDGVYEENVKQPQRKPLAGGYPVEGECPRLRQGAQARLALPHRERLLSAVSCGYRASGSGRKQSAAKGNYGPKNFELDGPLGRAWRLATWIRPISVQELPSRPKPIAGSAARGRSPASNSLSAGREYQSQSPTLSERFCCCPQTNKAFPL